jgi:PAS domain S-box-containing protein
LAALQQRFAEIRERLRRATQAQKRSREDLRRLGAELRTARLMLREDKERFAHVFERAPIAMALVGIDGRPLRVNAALCEMFGYSEPELLQRSVLEVTHPDDLPVTMDRLRRLIDGDIDTCQIEKRYLHNGGHAIWGLASVSLVRATDSAPLYLVSQVQDITERKQAEAAVRHRLDFERLLAMLTASSSSRIASCIRTSKASPSAR